MKKIVSESLNEFERPSMDADRNAVLRSLRIGKEHTYTKLVDDLVDDFKIPGLYLETTNDAEVKEYLQSKLRYSPESIADLKYYGLWTSPGRRDWKAVVERDKNDKTRVIFWGDDTKISSITSRDGSVENMDKLTKDVKERIPEIYKKRDIGRSARMR